MTHRDQFAQSPATPSHVPAPRRESDLRILSETTIVEIPRGRGGKEVLRFAFTMAETAEGKPVAWHSLRVWYCDYSGEWRPGKAGVSIRGREIGPIAAAMAKAVSGGVPAAAPVSKLQRALDIRMAPATDSDDDGMF